MSKSIKRRIIVVNRDFQYKFISMILMLVLLNGIIIIWNIHSISVSALEKVIGPQTAAEIIPAIHSTLFREHWLTMLFLLGVTVAIVTFICLFVSHQIAGPAYHISKVMKAIREGDMTARVNLRKDDFLKDLAKETNITLTVLEGRVAEFKSCAISGNMEKIKKLAEKFTLIR